MFGFLCQCFKKGDVAEAKQTGNQDFDLSVLPGPSRNVTRTYSESSVYSLKSTTSGKSLKSMYSARSFNSNSDFHSVCSVESFQTIPPK